MALVAQQTKHPIERITPDTAVDFLNLVRKCGDPDFGQEVGLGIAANIADLIEHNKQILETINWYFKNEKPEFAIEMVEQVSTFLLDSGQRKTRKILCEQALSYARKLNLTVNVVGLLARLGWSEIDLMNLKQAEAYLQEAWELSRTVANILDIKRRQVQIKRDLGWTYVKGGNFDRAFENLTQSEELATRIHDTTGMILAKKFRAMALRETGNLQDRKHSNELLIELLGEFKQSYPRHLVFTLSLLTENAIEDGHLNDAEQYLSELAAVLFGAGPIQYFEWSEQNNYQKLSRQLTEIKKSHGHSLTPDGPLWMSLESAEKQILLILTFFVRDASRDAIRSLVSVENQALDNTLLHLVQLRLIESSTSEHRNTDMRYALSGEISGDFLGKQPELWSFAEIARSQWCKYYVNFVERYGDEDLGGEVGNGIEGNKEHLELELKNIFNVINWCLAFQKIEAVHIIERITALLLDTGRIDERLQLCKSAYRIADRQNLIDSQVGLLQRVGWTYLTTGDDEEARTHFQKAQELAANHLDDVKKERLVQILRDQGYLCALRGHYDEGYSLLNSACSLADSTQSIIAQTTSKLLLARALCLEKTSESQSQAMFLLLDLLDQAQQNNFTRQILLIHKTLAEIWITRRDLKKAQQHLTAIEKYIDSQYFNAYVQEELKRLWGDWYSSSGNSVQAKKYYLEAYRLSLKRGMKREIELCRTKLTALGLQEYNENYNISPALTNATFMGERDLEYYKDNDSSLRDLETERLEPNADLVQKIDQYFSHVAGLTPNSEAHNKKSGPKPVQFVRIREAFRGSEDGKLVSLDYLAEFFKDTTQNPRHQVIVAIYKLNKAFAKFDIPLEIEGVTVTGRKNSHTFYRIQPWYNNELDT